MKPVKIFGQELIDDKTQAQLLNCLGPNDRGVLTADAHYGYGHPIGGAVAYKDRISLSGVGFDIACGNKAVRTNIEAKAVEIAPLMDEIVKQIGFGIGRPNPKPVDHPVLEAILEAPLEEQRPMAQMAASQLGTVGSGNHFVDVFEGDDGYLWTGVHFGSRGFGHKTTTGFIALSQGLSFTDRAPEGPMDSKPILFDTSTYLGQAYIEAIKLAGEYAYAGRDIAVQTVLNILGAEATFEVHNHHNFAWQEEHFGQTYWVVRKGCTPAFPGQQGFIGANMLHNSVIIEGVDTPEAAEGLYSTVHGAGRVMSRRQARGKVKWANKDGVRQQVVKQKGLIDYQQVKQTLKDHGVVVRGGDADEAPGAYKSLEDVLAAQGGTIRVLHVLRPIGVAMAGPDIHDPYKD